MARPSYLALYLIDEKADQGECAVCLETGVLYLTGDCGHLCVCETCGRKVDKCPLCRKTKTILMKVYSKGPSRIHPDYKGYKRPNTTDRNPPFFWVKPFISYVNSDNEEQNDQCLVRRGGDTFFPSRQTMMSRDLIGTIVPRQDQRGSRRPR